jgi:hypothetical protein
VDTLFFTAEISVLQPALKNRIGNDTPLPVGGLIRVPSVSLDTTVSPMFEVGYRLPDSCGQFSVGYRFFASEGNGSRDVNGVTVPIRTRADLNVIDLDYGTAPFEVAPLWDLSWRLGARIADVFFDSRAGTPGAQQQASNDFFGGGAHGRLDVERRIVPIPGLALFGRLDGAVVIGQIQQRFSAQATQPDGTLVSSSLTAHRAQAVPMLGVELGLSYVPPICRNLKFTTGYQFEQIWYLGQLGENADGSQPSSRGELWTHGWFLRGQVDF